MTGWYNTFIGGFAGQCTTSPQANTFIGNEAGKNNTSGGGNTYLGK